MADNYLGRKMEEYRERATSATHKSVVTLARLLFKNRSHRAYDASFVVRDDQLRNIIEVNTKIASAGNRQPLRFRAVNHCEAHKILPHIRMGAALPELHLPVRGTEPNAFIVICSTQAESREVDIDLGISAQSMLLRAVEMGLNGLCIGAFDAQGIMSELELDLVPLLIVAIGRGTDRIELVEAVSGDSLDYYREGGVHYVPKLGIDDIVLGSGKDVSAQNLFK